ncbi:MAG: hypothetical protein KF787_11845 [Phycisphaeraceae bacterium]|nr:hypothetical protein [Phycisphaerae bacterium]MBX3393327.1 hypothetical protein [Phycisphaeraceae bacterium]
MTSHPRTGHVHGRRRRSGDRRGVASILAMMFLILFGSLATAMAIASKGNIRNSATHLHVMRALGAAETGLRIGQARLAESTGRFIVSHSEINAAFGTAIWNGTWSDPDDPAPLASPSGNDEASAPAGIAQAVANLHAADQNIRTDLGVSVPTIGAAVTDADLTVYAEDGWVYTPIVWLDTDSGGDHGRPLAFSVTYAPLANGTDVRVIATGYDFDYKGSRPITRTVTQDFRLVKRVNSAINAPTRIMVGKNVQVVGDLAARYTDVEQTHGDPIVMRSDFFGLDPTLDSKLTDFFNALASHDVDGDNRLRIGHSIEGAGIPLDKDYDGDGHMDGAFADVTQDGFLDEFDIFLKHYDKNGDGMVVLSAALKAGTPAAMLTSEFVGSGGLPVDDDLAYLLDTANPDRNRNGLHGFIDTNGNGIWDEGEAFVDRDQDAGINRDQALGYRDGVLDRRDQYAKVRGRLVLKVSDASWKAARPDYDSRLRGSLKPRTGQSPRLYDAPDDVLPDIGVGNFSSSMTALKAAADGESFAAQVAAQLGISTGALAAYVETKPESSDQPRYLRLDPDNTLDGLPDNWETAYFEKMPYNSPNFSDYYYRPVYQNMTFKDVRIPIGTNALFRNCTFVGVTYVRTTTSNGVFLWSEYGRMDLDTGSGRPKPRVSRIVYGDSVGETSYPTMLPSSAIPPNQMILMALSSPLDKADIPDNMTGSINGYESLPEPLVIGGKRVTDTKPHSNNIRFHDCLFVGSIVSDSPSTYMQVRNKLQFTGKTRFTQRHPEFPDDSSLNPKSSDLAEIAKSSMMLPNYSVDIGTFNSPSGQNVALKGAIIAGVMDVRGNTSIDGALLLTFSPTAGQMPLVDALGNPVGNPAGFNTSLGYFGPEDGDEESLDPDTLPIIGGVRIAGWDTNGDGLADVNGNKPQPPGSTPVPFHGYGRIIIRFDPDMVLPNGVKLPLRIQPLSATYREGRL